MSTYELTDFMDAARVDVHVDRGLESRVHERKEHSTDGNWHVASGAFDGDLLEIISPSTEESVGRMPAAGPTEIDLAEASAQSAFKDGPWAQMILADRAGYLRQFAAELQARRDQGRGDRDRQ
jgi:delta 1-pyrroline-5-carboxylate dehydrogenase